MSKILFIFLLATNIVCLYGQDQKNYEKLLLRKDSIASALRNGNFSKFVFAFKISNGNYILHGFAFDNNNRPLGIRFSLNKQPNTSPRTLPNYLRGIVKLTKQTMIDNHVDITSDLILEPTQHSSNKFVKYHVDVANKRPPFTDFFLDPSPPAD